MRTMSLSLVSILSLGVALVGGRAIGGERASHTPREAKVEAFKPSLATTDRLWYGGTLAPIVVEGLAPVRLSTHSARSCSNRGT
jgi:hypothetical protein